LCYYADLDDETGRVVLLLEDILIGRVGNSLNGGTYNDAVTAIDYLIELHAEWYNNPKLSKLPWEKFPLRPEEKFMNEQTGLIQNENWSRCKVLFASQLPRQMDRVWHILEKNEVRLTKAFYSLPQTLCHGDFRMDNLFLAHSNKGSHIVAFDWQAVHKGSIGKDLFFLISEFTPEIRRSFEVELIDRYCTGMKKRGVEGLTLEQCLQAYHLISYNRFLVFVNIAPLMDAMTNNRNKMLMTTYFERIIEAIADHPLQTLLQEDHDHDSRNPCPGAVGTIEGAFGNA